MPDPKVSRRRQGDALAAGAGLVFLSFCLPRLRHSYDYDESVTVGLFVRQPDFFDAVTMQRVFNNHPLLTGVNWTVYRLGGESEAWQRLAPVSAGVACIVVVVAWCARRWGITAGVAAALASAGNPLLVSLSSQARGYSLAALAATVSTVLVLQEPPRDRARLIDVAYAASVALGLLAHLYVGIVFIGHGVFALRRGAESAKTWARSTLAGLVFAVFAYSPMLPGMVDASQARDGSFVTDFPLQVGDAMFGYRWAAIIAAGLILAVCVAAPDAHILAATMGGLVGAVWIVAQPLDLYPRFVAWAVPLFGLAAAALAARRRRFLVPVLAVGVASLFATVDQGRAEPDIRLVATAARSFEAHGVGVCAAGAYRESYVAYAVFEPVNDERRCDLAIVRSSDRGNPTVAGRSFAAIPGTTATCFAGSRAALRSVGLRPETCGG